MTNLNLLTKFILCITTLIAFSTHAMDDQSWLPCNKAPSADCPSPAITQQVAVILPAPRPMSPGTLTREVLELKQQNRTCQLALQEQAALIREQARLIREQAARLQEQGARAQRQDERAAEHARNIAVLFSLPEQLQALQETLAAHGNSIAGLAPQTRVTELERLLLTGQEQLGIRMQQHDQRTAEHARNIAVLFSLPEQLQALQETLAAHGNSIAGLAPQTRVTELERLLLTGQEQLGIRMQQHDQRTAEHARNIAALMVLPERLGTLQGQVAGNSMGLAEHGTRLTTLAGQLAALQQEIAAQGQIIAPIATQAAQASQVAQAAQAAQAARESEVVRFHQRMSRF